MSFAFDTLPTIHDIPNLKGKRVIVRMSLNVPVQNMKIVDDSRIVAGLPTIEFLRNAGARVIIIGHIGREKNDTLLHVSRYMEQFFSLTFVENIMSTGVYNIVDEMKDGDVIMFENLRRHDGEVNNDDAFAQHLAHLGDVYINDAFPVAHRAHASVVGIPKHIPGYLGIRFMEELQQLSKAFNPEHPFLFILGGAKVETKAPLLNKFITKTDQMIIGGVLANDFFKAQGHEIGQSVTSKEAAPLSLLKKGTVILPTDVHVLRDTRAQIIPLENVKKEDFIYDMGTATLDAIIGYVKKARFVLWNGPVGYCEKGFCNGTEVIAKALCESDAEVIVGGGDTLAAIPKEYLRQFSFTSMAGGAMLDFLAKETLPALEAIFLFQR